MTVADVDMDTDEEPTAASLAMGYFSSMLSALENLHKPKMGADMTKARRVSRRGSDPYDEFSLEADLNLIGTHWRNFSPNKENVNGTTNDKQHDKRVYDRKSRLRSGCPCPPRATALPACLRSGASGLTRTRSHGPQLTRPAKGAASSDAARSAAIVAAC